MKYEFELLEKEVQPVLSIRTRAAVSDLPEVLGNAYRCIIQYLGEINEQPCDAPFVAYYNMDMQDLDIEIGFPVSKKLPEKNEIRQSEIPAGKQVSCIHIGPYKDIEPAYAALMQWVTEKGYTPRGMSYEFYLNDPRETLERELQTKIVFPLN